MVDDLQDRFGYGECCLVYFDVDNLPDRHKLNWFADSLGSTDIVTVITSMLKHFSVNSTVQGAEHFVKARCTKKIKLIKHV